MSIVAQDLAGVQDDLSPVEYDQAEIDWAKAHQAGEPFMVCQSADDGVWLSRTDLAPAGIVKGSCAFAALSGAHNPDRVQLSPRVAKKLTSLNRELGYPAN